MGKSRVLLLAVSTVALCGVAAGASYDDVLNGNWDALATWDLGTGFPGTGDTATINSNIVNLNVDVNTGITSIDVLTGGGVRYLADTALQQAGLTIKFNGGKLWTDTGNRTYLKSNLNLLGSMTVVKGDGWSAESNLFLDGQITGAGQLIIDIQDNLGGGANQEGKPVVLTNATNNYTGGTIVYSGKLEARAVNCLGIGTVTVNAGAWYDPANSSGLNGYYAGLVLFENQASVPVIQVNAGGSLSLNAGVSNTVYTMPVVLNSGWLAGGGTFWDGYPGGATSQNGSVTMTDNSHFGGTGETLTINGVVSESGGSYKVLKDYGTGRVDLANAANSYTGGTDISLGQIRVTANGALSTGTVNVTGGGTLAFTVDQTAPPPIFVTSGGTIQNRIARNGGLNPLSLDFEVNAGRIGSSGGAVEYSGIIALAGDATVIGSQDIYFTGELTGAGKLIKTAGTTSVMNNVGAGRTGSTEVQAGTVRVDAAGALGSGTITAKTSGRILTNVANSLSSVSQAVADSGGSLELNSTEGGMHATIKAEGGFKVSGGSTVLTYSGAGANILVEKGAILDQDLDLFGGFPLASQLLPGDGGFGVFKAASVGTHTVGTASGTIFRGIATTANVTCSATVMEAAGGSEGVGTLATTGATYTYTGASLLADGTNTIKFYGGGGHIINTGNTLNNDLEKFGTGLLQVTSTDGINGKTLTMHGGWLDIDAADALNGATVVLKGKTATEPGAVFHQDVNASAGSITVEAGGAVWLRWQDGDTYANLAGGATWTFQKGSQLVIGTTTGYGGSTGWDGITEDLTPAMGKADLLIFNEYRGLGVGWRTSLVSGWELTDDTRITMWPQNSAGYCDDANLGDTAMGALTLAGGSTHGRLAGGGGKILRINGAVNFGADGTLIAGDVNPYYAALGNGQGFTNITQDGQVWLFNQTATPSVIGHIDIQAGTLRTDNLANLGGAADVNVNAGATFLLEFTPTIDAMTIKGGGTVRVGTGGTGTLTLNATGSSAGVIAPGSSAGALAVTGNLTVSNDGGGNYGRVAIEVLSSGNVAGTDHDALAVSGTANLAAGQMLVSLAVPSGSMRPTTPDWSQPGTPTNFITRNLGDMTVLTAGVAVTGTFASEVLDANPKLAGVQTTGPWQVKSGAVLADYASGNSVVLKGADIVWMALPGDANLDRAADVSDLSLLAGNFRKTVNQTWLQGDFNFDGRVDVSDLSLLAGRFRQTNPFPPAEGGATVPEPMTMVLLGLGGLAVLARRRRK